MNNVRKIASNAIFILVSDVVNRGTTFVLYALVARYLGPHEFGQMALALALFYTFQVLAVAGLKTYVTRQVAKDKTQTNHYLINGSLIVLLFSILAIILLLGFTGLMDYASDTTFVILLISLGLFPFALSAVCEAVFRAWEEMQFITYATVPVSVAKVGLAFLILNQGHGLPYIIAVLVFAPCAIALIEWGLMCRYIIRPYLEIDLSFSVTMVKETATFLGIDVIRAIWSSLPILLLSKLASETQVGLYSSAAQLMVPMVLILRSVVLSVFPVMCRKFDSSPQSLQHVSQSLIELLLSLTLPVVVGLFFIADNVLLLLYADRDFLSAAGVLRILVWGLISSALTFALGQILLAGLQEKVTLRIVAVNALITLVCGFILINQFGIFGAAVATIITGIINFFQHYIPVSKMLPNLSLEKFVWKPIVAVTFMAAYLTWLGQQNLFLTITSAAMIYGTVLLTLFVWSIGGPYQFKAKYRYLWSR